jgi:RHS repeat-associated protein
MKPAIDRHTRLPYLFTGRRVDILDNGSLKIQYNRNRYYDYYTGRWLTHDPLSIAPNAEGRNRFGPVSQYADGLCLYGYCRLNPLNCEDPMGLNAACVCRHGLQALQLRLSGRLDCIHDRG